MTMPQCVVRGVRSVELVATNFEEADRFYRDVWHLDHQTDGEQSGTVLATMSALNGSDRPIPCAQTAA